MYFWNVRIKAEYEAASISYLSPKNYTIWFKLIVNFTKSNVAKAKDLQISSGLSLFCTILISLVILILSSIIFFVKPYSLDKCVPETTN